LGRVIEQKPAEGMLRKVERGYRDLFESVSEALIVVDPRTGIIQDANPRASDLYGVPRDRMLGSSVHGLWSDAGVGRAAIERARRRSPPGSGCWRAAARGIAVGRAASHGIGTRPGPGALGSRRRLRESPRAPGRGNGRDRAAQGAGPAAAGGLLRPAHRLAE